MSENELQESGNLLDELAKAPPEPMVISEAAAPAAQEAPKIDPKKYHHLTDYKGRAFDPTLHKVKFDGSPEVNCDGSLKIMRGKGGLVDKIKGFAFPKSDHEMEAETISQGNEQAAAIVESEQRRVSAENSAELYFATGSIVFGGGFLTDSKKRRPRIAAHIEAYEQATGKTFDLPPGIALAVGLFGDMRETIEREKECKEKFSAYVNGVKRIITGIIINKKVFGWFSWAKKKPKQVETEGEAA